MEEKYRRRRAQRQARMLRRLIVRLVLVLSLLCGAAALVAARRPENTPTAPSAPPITTVSPTVGSAPPTVPPTTQPKQEEPEDFFDDAVFLGDSVTMALRNYCMETGALGQAQFLCAGNYAVRHAVAQPGQADAVSVTWQGSAVTPAEAVAQTEAKKVFLLLGLNDIVFGLDWAMENWAVLVESIHSQCPGVAVYIQSATPVTAAFEGAKLNNSTINAYNGRLQAFAWEHGCHYIDVASALKDKTGALAADFCSDGKCHLTRAGVQTWVDILRQETEDWR